MYCPFRFYIRFKNRYSSRFENFPKFHQTVKRIKFSHSQTRTNNKIFFNTSFYHPFHSGVWLKKTKEKKTKHLIFFTKVTNNEQKRTCVFGVIFSLRNKLYLQTKVENIKFYLSLKTNQKFLSLSQLNKLSKISAKIICKKTNFIHRYGVLHNNQHLLYWVKMRKQPQIKINNNK